MPDYGLIVKNNNEEIQIDSTYRNLSLDQSDTSTISAATKIAITASLLVPLCLVRPNTDRFIAVRSYSKTGSNFDGINILTEYDQSTSIGWQVYRENRTASGENYGLLVYNSSGELCFDSGKNYFKIFSVHTITLTGGPYGALGDYEDISHAGISNPYYILSPSSYWVVAVQGAPGRLYVSSIGIKKLTSTSVRVGWFSWINVATPYPGPGDPIAEGLNPTMKLIVCAP